MHNQCNFCINVLPKLLPRIITVLTTNAAVSAYSVMNCPWKFIKLGDVHLVLKVTFKLVRKPNVKQVTKQFPEWIHHLTNDFLNGHFNSSI